MAKRALITGVTGNIGEALAKKYALEGYTVIAPTRAEMDLQDFDSIHAFFEKQQQVDVLVNNAGINQIADFDQFDPVFIEKTVAVNLVAPMLLSRAVLPYMKAQGWGRIVNISSIYAQISRPGRVLYTTTKSGLNGLTTGLANEYADHNILVNAVLPGFVDTKLTRQNNTPEQIETLCRQRVPVGRLATVEEVADLVFQLGSEQNTYITGQAIAIDGGVLTA